MYNMILTTKPDLKIIDKNKLHISRRPRLTSWLFIFLSVIVFFEIFRRLTDSVFFTMVSLLGEVMFGLDTLGEWEDLVLDKEQNKAIVTRCTWSDKLVSRSPKRAETFIKLSDIRHVGVSMDMGLFFVCRDGETITFDTRGLTREEIQNYRKEINYFLNMSKIESLNERRLDPYERIVATSDSEDETSRQAVPRDCQLDIPESEESLTKITHFDKPLGEKIYLLQEPVSSSSLQRIHRKGSQEYLQQHNPKRGRYTENSIVKRVTSACSKHGCDPDWPGR